MSKRRCCELLGLNRSTVYYAKQSVSAEDQAIMEAIDRQYAKDPCDGVRRMSEHLNTVENCHVNYKRVRRLMHQMNLVAILDWATRYVLSWRISTSLESSFCVEVPEEALAKYGLPETRNTDQGSQFTGKLEMAE